MNFVKLSAAALSVAMTATIVPVAAHAAMDETIVEARMSRPVAHVSFADLNLAKSSDVATLHRRVSRAAKNICTEYGSRDVVTVMNGLACRDAAIDSAAPQIAAAVDRAGVQVASNATITVAMP